MPRFYSFFQDILGAAELRRFLVDNVIALKAGERVLDIGCGPGEMYPYLDGADYVGVDRSAEYIQRARSRFGSPSRFLIADASDLPQDLKHGFDAILAIALLHHLSDEEVRSCIRTAAELLAPGGRFISLDPTLFPGQSCLARLVIRSDRGKFVRSPSRHVELCEEVFGCVDARVRSDLLRIPYSHVIVACSQSQIPRPDRSTVVPGSAPLNTAGGE